MDCINFIISRMNYLPYFVPLVMEGNKRNIKSNFFLCQSKKKFIDPYESTHLKELQLLSNTHKINLYDISKLIEFPSITFFCEGDIVGKENKDLPSSNFKYMTPKHIKVSIVCNYEYVMFYDNYINNVDYVIMPHTFWETYYQKKSIKNLCLGSPKYDMDYYKLQHTPEDRNKYLSQKYNIDPTKKYVLIVFPKDPKKHHKSDTLYPTKPLLLAIYDGIREMGYSVIVKTRAQDPVKDTELKGDYYFEDIDYYPCNSMELIELSRMIIYFSSSINEECVALKTPYLDIKVDQAKDRFDCINDKSYGFSVNINVVSSTKSIKLFVQKTLRYYEQMHYQPDKIDSNKVFTTYYTNIINESGHNASRRIIDWAISKYNPN
jgi:hypothetical protein